MEGLSNLPQGVLLAGATAQPGLATLVTVWSAAGVGGGPDFSSRQNTGKPSCAAAHSFLLSGELCSHTHCATSAYISRPGPYVTPCTKPWGLGDHL